MRTISCAVLFSLSATIAAGSASAQPAPGSVRFEGSKVYSSGSFAERPLVVREGMVVSEVSAGDPVKTVDLRGMFIVPAFGDAHTHRFTEADAEATAMFLGAGFAYAQNLNGNEESRRRSAKDCNTSMTPEVRFANAGFTCTNGHPVGLYRYLDGLDKSKDPATVMSRVADFNFYITDRLEDVPAKWTRFARTDPDMVKIFLLNSQRWAESSGSPPSEGLRPEVAKDIGDRATKSGLRASAHVESARDIEVAIAAGVDLLAHMPGYGLRADTKVDDYVVSDAAMKAAAAAGMSLTPTLAPVYADPNKSEEVAKITAWKREQVARWKAAGVPILYGSDNYFDLQSELRAMIDSKIWTGAELVEMLSVRTPRWILPGRAVGSLEPGSEAVFAVLRADPIADPSALLAVEAVYKDGVKIWPRDNKPANP